MRPARPFHGYISKGFPAPLDKIQLATNDTIPNELFAALELYSEVKLYGRELLKNNGHTNLKKAHSQFRAYIRQARMFFEAANALHYRASPLLYYYSFMNLAKALIQLRDPQFADNGLLHGLKYKHKKTALRNQSITVQQKGIFPQFYRAITGVPIQGNAKFNLKTIFSYVSDVSYEFRILKFGQSRFFSTMLAIATDNQNSTPVMAIGSYNSPTNFDLLNAKSLKDFEEVSVTQTNARNFFNLTAETQGGFSFFESKKLYPNVAGTVPVIDVVKDIVAALGTSISYCPTKRDALFVLNLPIATPSLKPFREELAIYCTMYYLGSLVRYHPHFLESLLETRDAWIIERFIKQTPITFLRHMRNAIDGQYLALIPG